MKTTPLFSLLFLSLPALAAAPLSCKKKDGNLCYRIDGTQRSRIDRSQAFQKALGAVARKMEGKSVVYIVQGYRTPQDQQRLVNQHCGGRSSCAGYASARTSRHVISVAADPMLYGNQVKSVCHAENQARVEFLGPRSAAAVYGYDRRTNLTWAHIDDSTGSNYTPHNCGRNEGLVAGRDPNRGANDTGAPTSQRVEDFRNRGREPAAACSYYAILSCHRTQAAADGARAQFGSGTQVIHTDDVPSFNKGWYCVTGGAQSQGDARATVTTHQGRASTGYVKKGC